MPLRVVTFNMQNGQPGSDSDLVSPELDIMGSVVFLRGLNADIVCLQEVEQGYDGGMQINPPPHHTRLKELLPAYESIFSYPSKNDTELPFGLGLAIFSRLPLTDFHKIDLPASGLEFEFAGKKRQSSSRLLIEASAIYGGRKIRILNTHLQAFFMLGASSDDHTQQRDAVEARLRNIGAEAAILAGDMNSAPGESLVRQFENVGFRNVQNDQPTWQRRPYVLDHIFYNASLHLVSQHIEKTTVSDHHAVIADFEFV
jgi:endonuclease/exonuclease/phosphatase family metal-dependent hydrolase